MEDVEAGGGERSLWTQTDGDAHADGPHYERSAPRRLARPKPSSPGVDYAHEAVRRHRAAPVEMLDVAPPALEPWRRVQLPELAGTAAMLFVIYAQKEHHDVAARVAGNAVQVGVLSPTYGIIRATWKAGRFVNATGNGRRMNLTEVKALLLR
jgi:hypothetical protein